MIDLKRNSKKELVLVTGIRSRSSSIYKSNQSEDFKISRGKFSNFLTCPRCFYLDRVVGLDPPGTPGWTLNDTTDHLLKKEFDDCRNSQTPHRLFLKNGLEHVVPYQHPDMDKWRDSLHHGLTARFEDTNIILTGGVDDIWQNTKNGKLILVDYKSQANSAPLEPKTYLSDVYKHGYKVQIDFYAYLLQKMGFDVEDTAFFLVCNADRDADGFYGKMNFQEVLIPYLWKSNWIREQIVQMIKLLNDKKAPEANSSCKNCAYTKQANLYEKNSNNEC